MQLRFEIPDTFWSLFRSVNREIYMEALLCINQEYEYSNLSAKVLSDKIKASIDVENTGEFSGTETVQFYIQDVISSSARPVRELKGYKKVNLEPHEKATVEVEIPFSGIGCYNESLEYTIENGEFKIWAGHDSQTELSVSVYIEN